MTDRKLVLDPDRLGGVLGQWRYVDRCQECYGTGEVFTHADDCDDDLCALNGDIHSCCGQLLPCGCRGGAG